MKVRNIVGEVVLGLLVLICLILSIMGVSYFSFAGNFLLNVEKSWDSHPVTQIYETKDSCPSGGTLMNLEWPGTVSGCDCRYAWGRMSRNKKFKINRGTCSFNMTLAGCSGIRSYNPIKLQFWRSTKLCIKKETKTYYDLAKSMSSPGRECPYNTKHCGIIDSLGNNLCYPVSSTCPLNKIIIQDDNQPAPSDYTYGKILLKGNKVLYHTNQAIKEEIFVSFRHSEGKVCLDPTQTEAKYGSYVLDRSNSIFSCGEYISGLKYDTRYKLLDSYSKRELYDENGITPILNTLPGYPLKSLEAHVNVFSSSYVGWRKECMTDRDGIDMVPKARARASKIYYFQIAILVMTIIKVVEFIVLCIIIKVLCRKNIKKNKKTFGLISEGIFIIFSFVLMILSWVNYGHCADSSGLLDEIKTSNCGDIVTTKVMEMLALQIITVKKYNFYLAIANVLCMCIYPILYLWKRFLKKKKKITMQTGNDQSLIPQYPTNTENNDFLPSNPQQNQPFNPHPNQPYIEGNNQNYPQFNNSGQANNDN